MAAVISTTVRGKTRVQLWVRRELAFRWQSVGRKLGAYVDVASGATADRLAPTPRPEWEDQDQSQHEAVLITIEADPKVWDTIRMS